MPRQGGSVIRRFFQNTMVNFAGQAYLLVLAFATAPYIVHRLGAELFGIVALVQTIAGFAGIVNLGIGRALTKYVSGLYWKQDFKEIARLFQSAWATCVIGGVIGLIVLIGPKATIGRLFFRGGSEVGSVIGLAVYVAAFGLFASILLEAVSALPMGTQRFGIYNVGYVVSGTVRYLGSVAVLALGYSIRSVLVMNLAASIVAVVIFAIASARIIPDLSFIPKIHRDAFRTLFNFSLPLFIAAISSLIVVRVDRLILAYFLPLAAVTFYSLPYTLAEKAATGVVNVTSVVYPYTSELHSQGSHDKVHELYLRSTKILTLITLPFSVILITLPGPILRYWLGAEYATQGAAVLGMLGAATFLNAASGVATVSALGVGRAWMPAGFAIGSSVVNVVANLLLIPRYGINGAALAALIPQAVVAPIFVYTVTRELKFSQWRLLAHGYLRPLVSAIVQVVVLLFLRPYVNNLIELGALCALSLCVYAVVSAFVAMNKNERAALLRLPVLRQGQKFVARESA